MWFFISFNDLDNGWQNESWWSQIVWGCVLKYSNVVEEYMSTQYSTVQYRTEQYSTEQYITVQYSTVQYSTVQYERFVVWRDDRRRLVDVSTIYMEWYSNDVGLL